MGVDEATIKPRTVKNCAIGPIGHHKGVNRIAGAPCRVRGDRRGSWMNGGVGL